ncbi:MAG: DUF6483 family protein [Treponema sp.]|jgi:hypothetical protein|nr:DUF6483 family protein [Treponema sp.]
MSQKDYIIRMIDQLAACLWSIVCNKKIGNYEYALEEIEQAYNTLLNSDGNTIKQLNAAAISKANASNSANITAIASLLFEEADILECINGINAISAEYYQKAFLLLLTLKTGQYTDTLDQIILKMDAYVVNYETKRLLMFYFEGKGLYGKAEDCLFDLIENNYPNIVNEGKALYTRLLEKDDDVLEQGNLPRSEIVESLAQL